MKELRKIKNPWLHKPGYNCICCSPTNPLGLHLEFWEDGEDIITHWKPSSHYQGWLNTLHGGIQSMLLDEVAGWVVTRKLQTKEEMGFVGCELEETEYEKFRREEMERFEDDITEGRCYPEMPEGQFIRSK